jgi:hypothetical protein
VKAEQRFDITAGEAALAVGDWEAARAGFAAALAEQQTPQALEGLSRALWWLRDEEGAIWHLALAYAAYREAGDAVRAASAALWLSREYAAAYGNQAASGGWFARAEGLLRDADDVVERGWLALMRAERSSAPGRDGAPRGGCARVRTTPQGRRPRGRRPRARRLRRGLNR